uniref:15-oxoprostaglandin 13-reductase n=1 Tax=Biomphalaria glabrata TaxID=6526 RepID=A0A2C9M3K2_BIOGL
MVTMAKVWRLSDSFHGLPRVENFVLTEEELPSLSSKDILIGAVYLSLDPYFRVFSSGKNLPGEQVGRVLDSKSAEYPVGSLVCVHAGWRSHSVINVTKPRSYGTKVVKIVDVSGVSPSLWLGAAGMPGYIKRFEQMKGQTGQYVHKRSVQVKSGTIWQNVHKRFEQVK